MSREKVESVVRKPPWYWNQTNLEVYDDEEDGDSCHQVHQVGEVLSVESLTETPDFVSSGGEQVEESDDCSLKLGTFAGVDCCGRERFPDDRLTDVGSDEQGNTAER